MGTPLLDLALACGLGGLALAGLGWLAVAGFRHGDRPLDARVSAELRDSGQPDEPRPVVVAAIENPSGAAVLVGLAARPSRLPALLKPGSVAVPALTSRRGLRAGAFETVSVVPARATVRLTVPVSATGRRYRLVAAIGQPGGRLRLHKVPVDSRSRLRHRARDLADRGSA
ncbi:MAG TPA: hypothetical protein VMG38_10970 [Trebonia sp.]|nr:hypothetical protein [Trebonia sp.]